MWRGTEERKKDVRRKKKERKKERKKEKCGGELKKERKM